MTNEKNPPPATPATPPPAGQLLTTKELFSDEKVRAKFVELLGKKAQGFIVSVLQVVGSSELLKKADPNSVYNAAAVAATLDLPLNNQLGFAYIVPYNVSKKVKTAEGERWTSQVVAQFQVGYKGYIQLAQRTGQYHKIAATKILEGQLISADPLEGYEFDFKKPIAKGAPVIGYASRFKLLNGFEKTLYMSVEELENHARKFSKSYGQKNSLWETEDGREAMYLKTVLKLNLSKFGPMSIELQNALITDQALIENADTLDVKYVDNAEDQPVDKERERLDLLIANAKSVEDLDPLRKLADLDQAMAIARREIEILGHELTAADKIADDVKRATKLAQIRERIKALEELTA